MGSGFQATEMWRDMVGILQTKVRFSRLSSSWNIIWPKVTVKNRRHLLKSYNGVFTGSNAVDVLFGQKQERPDLFTDNTTRENIVRLCQRFLETRVFFPAKVLTLYLGDWPVFWPTVLARHSTVQVRRLKHIILSIQHRWHLSRSVHLVHGQISIFDLGAPETGRKPFQDVSNSNRGQQCQQLRASSEPDLTRVDCAMRWVWFWLFWKY